MTDFLGELVPWLVIAFGAFLYLAVPKWLRWEQLGRVQDRRRYEQELRSRAAHPAGDRRG